MRVYGRGEMVIERSLWLPPDVSEHVKQVHLYVSQVVRVSSELGVVPTDVGLLTGHLPGKEVGFVQEQDDGDAFEVDVVDYGVEDVERFLETVGFPGMRKGCGVSVAFYK